MAKLDPVFKANWVAALRSGEFKQTTKGYLKLGNAYCCLGVGCVVAGVPIPIFIHGRAVVSYAPLNDKVGLSARASRILAAMNDGGKSFPEIADYIEANL